MVTPYSERSTPAGFKRAARHAGIAIATAVIAATIVMVPSSMGMFGRSGAKPRRSTACPLSHDHQSASTGCCADPAEFTLIGASGSIEITRRPLIFTGSRTYDGGSTAIAGVLNPTNVVGTDDVGTGHIGPRCERRNLAA